MTRRGSTHERQIDAYVGARMTAKRTALKLSQSEVARRLGITFQQIQKYEKGLNRVSASRLLLIAEILREEPSWFLPDAGAGKAVLSAQDRLATTKGGLELAQLFLDMAKDRQDSLLSVARSLAGPSVSDLQEMLA